MSLVPRIIWCSLVSGPSSDCFGVYCQAAREIPGGLPVLSPVLATMAEGPLFNYEAQKVDNLLKLKRGELSNDAATWLILHVGVK